MDVLQRAWPFILLLVAGCTAPASSTLSDIYLPPEHQLAPAPGVYPATLDEPPNAYEQADYSLYMSHARDVAQRISSEAKAIKSGAAQPGCIGQTLDHCLATISQYLALTSSFQYGAIELQTNQDSQDPFIASSKIDVNGNVLSQHEFKAYAFMPEDDLGMVRRTRSLELDINTGPDGRVKDVSALLLRDPLRAVTEAEYDQTGIFPVLRALCGPTGVSLDKLSLYRFVENRVKPALSPNHDFEASMANIRETRGQDATVGFCGRQLFFYSFAGNSIDSVTENNTTGVFGGASIKVE